MDTSVRRVRVEIEFKDGTRHLMVLRNPKYYVSNLERHLTQVLDTNGAMENIPTGLMSLTLSVKTTNFFQKFERNDAGKGRAG